MNNRGTTYDCERDGPRLAAQLSAVYEVMKDGKWRTLTGIAMRVHAPEASVSARLRDLRKEDFGGYEVQRHHVGNGLHKYRVVVGSGR